MLLLPIIIATQAIAIGPRVERQNLPETLYYASEEASGSRLCDQKRKARYAKLFTKRFGRRVELLIKYAEGRFGPSQEYIVLTFCRSSGVSGHLQDERQERAMDRYEMTLRDLERRFGPERDGS